MQIEFVTFDKLIELYKQEIAMSCKQEREIRDMLKEFIEKQRKENRLDEELRENDHKGGWENEPIDWLLDRLEEEAKELYYATGSPGSAEKIIHEAADVANFAMMIADNIRRACGINALKGEKDA